MKLFLSMLLLLSFSAALSNTYYFSESSGNDLRTSQQAQNMSTPWRSLRKLNDFMPSLQPGDSILFKRGEVFNGFISVTVSGTSGQPLTFSAYGQGSRPVISGFSTVLNWSPTGNGVWEAGLSSASVNIMLFNGNVTAMGRFPNAGAANSGFLTIESTLGPNQFTDGQLFSNPDWTGGEAVIRKNRWVLDRDSITLHSGNTLNVLVTSGYSPAKGFGYFIQGHLRTLDQAGEWYFNASAQKLYVYFGANGPSQTEVKAGTGSHLVLIGNESYILFTELRFEGANANAFHLSNARHAQIRNCDILFTGINAINAGGCNDVLLEGCNIHYTNNIAFNANNCSNVFISNNTISKTGIYAGMGQNNSGSYEAIILNGDNNRVEYNSIDSTGYIPVTFGGNAVLIKNNFIRSFAFIKDDGGGIYTWNNAPNAQRNFDRRIIANIILHGRGAGQGTDERESARVHGIYIDDNSANVDIMGNSIAYCGQHGIFIHNAYDLTVKSNTVYDNSSQLVLAHDEIAPNALVRNIRSTDNVLFSKLSTQLVAEYKTIGNDLNNMGFFDSNYYCRPMNDELVIYTSYRSNGTYRNTLLDLEAWQAQYNKDLHSSKSPAEIAPYSINSFTGGNRYGNGNFNNDIGGLYVFSPAGNSDASWTNAAGLDNGALKVRFTSQSTAYNQAYVIIGIGSLAANRNYILRFSSISSNEYRNMQAFLRKSLSPYNDVSERRFRRLRTNRTENEFLFTSYTNESDASIVLELEEQPGPVHVDNIQLYESNVTLTHPEDSIRFEYNASASPRAIALDGSYVDARRNTHTGSITLDAYSSVVLIKKRNLAVLPLQFLLFRGMREGPVINLYWTTAPDEAGGYYEVERSGDGTSLKKIGQVAASISASFSYRYSDVQPLTGRNYYRVKYIKGNRPVYSKIILVDRQGLKLLHELKDSDMILRPNPVINTLQVVINAFPILQPATLVIQTATGSVVQSLPVYLINNEVNLNISTLSPGAYTIQFFCDGKILRGRFVKGG